MADSTVSALTALLGTDVADGDLLPIVDVSASAGQKNKKITRNELRAAIFNSDYIVIPAAFEAAGGFIVNPGGVGKTFYSSHGLASIGEGAFSYAGFTYAALTHTLKTGTAGDVDALVLAADGSANFPVGASVDGDDVVTDGTLAAALAALGVPQSVMVTMTAADLAALGDSPQTLVAAAGANKILIPHQFAWYPNFNGGLGFSDAGNLKINWADIDGEFAAGMNADPWHIDGALVIFPAPYICTTTNPKYLVQSEQIETPVINEPIVLTASTAPSVFGSIQTSTLNNGGSGYAIDDTFVVDDTGGGGGILATGTVNTVDGGGAVLTYTIDTAGNTHLVSPDSFSPCSTTATSGAGSGLTLNLVAMDYSVNPLIVKMLTTYSVMNVA